MCAQYRRVIAHRGQERRGWDYPTFRVGSGLRASLFTLALRAPPVELRSNLQRLVAYVRAISPRYCSSPRGAEGVGLSNASRWLWFESFAIHPCASRPTSRTAFESPKRYDVGSFGFSDRSQVKSWRRGWDYPTLCVGSGVRASLLTLARDAPRQSNCVRNSRGSLPRCAQYRRVIASRREERRGWDSNPRELALCRFSRPEPSTTRPPLLVRAGILCH
ncbi:MAG: hypothetical protein QOG67_3767 [Verrucomicrobiota bacterium]